LLDYLATLFQLYTLFKGQRFGPGKTEEKFVWMT